MEPIPPPLPPRPLQYADPGLNRRPITSIRQTITLGAISAILFAELMWVAPRMEQVFRDFKTDLPAVTQVTLYVSRFARNNILAWPVFLAIPLFVPMATTALIWRPGITPGQYRLRQFLFGSMITMLFALLAVAIVLGLFVAYISLINSVSGVPKR